MSSTMYDEDHGFNLLELSDAVYNAKVLLLPDGEYEAKLDSDLDARASALGLATSQSPSDKRNTASTESAASTVETYHTRTCSTGSNNSAGTALTADSSLLAPSSPRRKVAGAPQRKHSSSLNFAHYDAYLARISPNLNQPKFCKDSVTVKETGAKSLFSVKTTRSLFSIKSSISRRVRWRRKSIEAFDLPLSCICCRDDFSKGFPLHNLPCGHTYCGGCLAVMANQATTDEGKMPPRCCTQPILGNTIKTVLDRESQAAFLKSVLQFSTPWEARIFCPNPTCGEFIPPRPKVDPKHPFAVTCRSCRTRVCVMCKRNAHGVGKDCPEDYELDEVLKMGEKSGWRRCYKCRNLVELAQGCTHMTCRCKAQFCYICGGVWDATVGCPNVCSGEEELERRRLEEEVRMAEFEAEKIAREAAAAIEAIDRAEAEQRSMAHPDFQQLRNNQEAEKERFLSFILSSRSAIHQRHNDARLSLADKHADATEKMRERHAKTASHLEDRQIAAEMELRHTLEHGERSVRIRLKHMEAYCDGLGRGPSSAMPARTVTERDLRELGQQYNLRDGMERLHQSKINVMRDRQAKRMEELLDRHGNELGKLEDKRQEDLETLASQFANEEEAIVATFQRRRENLQRRWRLAIEILRKELADKDSTRYELIPLPEWLEEEVQASDSYAEGAF